ncbi:UvrD-helicase domain-containing protein [Micromonospora sp. WMMA1923]|uniref:UvrD-helicase domain-containing protein n=1 Tax=Micromonospora sp. WMMA1923 TaxID=3404125 RepID=UPI003B926D0C
MAGISDQDLAYEIATNRSYLQALERRLARKNPEIAVSANERYVDNVPRGERATIGPLCGRVGLAGPDRHLGVAFYIGTRYLNSTDWDYPVINWAARAAKVFFDPHAIHELDHDVVVRRTLTARGAEVVHASDDWVVTVPVEKSPLKPGKLNVPPAPPRRQTTRRAGSTPSSARTTTSTDHPAGQTPATRQEASPAPPPRPRKPGKKPTPAAPTASGATSAKKGTAGRLPLPAKPADLATWHPNGPLVVAFSGDFRVDPDAIAAVRAVDVLRHLGRKRRRVLVVSAWTTPIPKIVGRIHTAAALVGLPAADVPKVITVVQETDWLVGIAGYPRFTDTRKPDKLDVGRYVQDLVEQAVQLCHRRLGWAHRAVDLSVKLKVAYEVIRMGGVPTEPLRLGRYSAEWIETLPPFRSAWGQLRYLALFAQLVTSLKGPDSQQPYGHVIVHGEHDFSGLACAVLSANNPTAQWTVLTELTGPGSPTTDKRRMVNLVERLGVADNRREIDVIAVPGAGLVRHTIALPRPKSVPAPPPESPDRGPQPTEHRQRSSAAIDLENGMRAVDAVRYALHAPRTEAMTSVLATLQPDQYRLVTQPPTMPLIIQGHPGTGKTIIAVHRAGYLVNEETTKKSSIPRVLLLGPTEQYVRHVSRTVRELDPTGAITVKSLPEWLAELAGLGTTAQPGEGTAEDVGGFIVGLAKHAVLECQKQPEWKASRLPDKIRIAYEAIRSSSDPDGRPPTSQTEQRWIETLPPFPKAWGKRRYLPLFAQLGLLLSDRQSRYGHIVVDEAQDVSELEWEIIQAHNTSGRWTIVGDLNQRRRLDINHLDWHQLARRLHILPDAELFEPEVVERGYRSTQPILDFANCLLPSTENQPCSLQTEGPEPAVIRASTPGKRDLRAVTEAGRLLDSYPGGTAAIITTDPEAIDRLLLSDRWRRADTASGAGDWTREERRLAVRTPDSARGVEFDGVVVVEPRYFVRQEEFTGTLYTSLTRANRELVVVHSKPLPDPLTHR